MAAAGNGRQGASIPAICEAPTQEGPAGFPCPVCGTRTNVLNSRPLSGTIRRRRECPSCLHRLSTVEVPTEEVEAEKHFRRHILPRLRELRRWISLLDDFKDPE